MNTNHVSPESSAIILLNFRGKDDTLACLKAIAAMPEQARRVVIVDNGSGDDSMAAMQQWLIETKRPFFRASEDDVGNESLPEGVRHVLLPLSKNDGYAAGNNAGVRLAFRDPGCRAFWILNNDTEPQADALAALCRCLNGDPTSGMAGSTIVYAHAPEILQCAGGFALNKLLGTTSPLYGGIPASKALQQDHRHAAKLLDYISGASLLVRRRVFEKIGFLAEEYFLYYEDAEFGIRARKSGHGLSWAKDSIVRHKEGGSSGAATRTRERPFSRPLLVDYLSLRNRAYLMRAHFPLASPFVAASFFGVMAKRLQRGQGARIPLVLKALWHGLTKKVGKPCIEDIAPCKRALPKNVVLFISARADFGGGPEHLWQLLAHMPSDMRACVACPTDYPYHKRFCDLLGAENVVEIPHRRFHILALWRLKRFCKKHEISVLHSHGKGAGLYSRLLVILTGLPCVHTFHGVHMGQYGKLKKIFYRWYEKQMSRLTKIGIAVSVTERDRVLAEGLMPFSKLEVIQNGVNVPHLAGHVVTSQPYKIISITRFDYAKNSLFVTCVLQRLREINRLEEFKFVLIGDGPEKILLERRIHEEKMSKYVKFTGNTPSPQSFFAGALCYFSSSRWEGMPLAVLEAMAYGLPPVVSDVVGNRDIVEHERTGLLYQEGNAIAASECICSIADNLSNYKFLSLSAKQFVLDNNSIVDTTNNVWNKLRNCIYYF